ncbi:MAG: class I SAM-dependent methyltransferase [Vicinamibacterales bacterium]
MHIRRSTARKVHFILDECIPPVIRDARWFMWIPFKVLFGKKAGYFFSFKDRAIEASSQDVHEVYMATADVHIRRETDLNEDCIAAIKANIVGTTVLDVGCGRGFLADELSRAGLDVTGCDFRIADDMRERFPSIRFEQARAEALPFGPGDFDTVICTHTLEHVQNLAAAINELRRVARRRLIVVVPRQRPYRYTFDLHLHFFPYKHSLLAHFTSRPGITGRTAQDLDGDWYYQEDISV